MAPGPGFCPKTVEMGRAHRLHKAVSRPGPARPSLVSGRPFLIAVGASYNGITLGSGPSNRGSNPCAPAKIPVSRRIAQPSRRNRPRSISPELGARVENAHTMLIDVRAPDLNLILDACFYGPTVLAAWSAVPWRLRERRNRWTLSLPAAAPPRTRNFRPLARALRTPFRTLVPCRIDPEIHRSLV